MAIDYTLIGKRIKEARKEKGFTQELLAEKIDVTVGYVSQIERGVSKVNLEKLSEISTALGCELAYFISGCSYNTDEYLLQELNEKYMKLSPEQKKNVIGFIDVMLN